MPDELRIRQGVRALLTDRDRRVLLVHFDFDDVPGGVWACPGGGINPGEAPIEALVRELSEEVGLTITDPGEPIWWKEHIFSFSRWDGQRDTYFWLEVDAFEPRPQLTEAELWAEHVDGVRWWTWEELGAAQAAYDSGRTDAPEYAMFSPRRLAHLVEDLISQGRPAELLRLDPQ